MQYQDAFILMGVGGVFLIVGLISFFWGRREEKSYSNAISTRYGDTREFMDHWPQRPQPGALKVGGWIAIAIGVVMLVVGLALRLSG